MPSGSGDRVYNKESQRWINRPKKRPRETGLTPALKKQRINIIVEPKSPESYKPSKKDLKEYGGYDRNFKIWSAYVSSRYDVCVLERIVINFKNAKTEDDVIENGVDIEITDEAIDALNKCKHRFALQFVVIKKLWPTRHANGLLIDREYERIYHFEPNGYAENYSDKLELSTLIIELLPDKLEALEGYTVVPPVDICPTRGIQAKEVRDRFKLGLEIKGEIGYCMAWSMLFLHYCITNPNVHPKNIVDYLLAKDNLTEIIRRYISYLINKVGFLTRTDKMIGF